MSGPVLLPTWGLLGARPQVVDTMRRYLEQIACCAHCLGERRERLARMNREQQPLPPIACPSCGGSDA